MAIVKGHFGASADGPKSSAPKSSVPESSVPKSGVPNWRELYTVALLEGDRERLSFRVDEAEKAILLRGQELFGLPGDTSEEAGALDDALYALRALRTCLRLKTRESTAA
jgi:hypothetical protein